jgi:hypothetical protein
VLDDGHRTLCCVAEDSEDDADAAPNEDGLIYVGLSIRNRVSCAVHTNLQIDAILLAIVLPNAIRRNE